MSANEIPFAITSQDIYRLGQYAQGLQYPGPGGFYQGNATDFGDEDAGRRNGRLKRMYAEMSMQNDLLKEVLGKSSEAIPKEGDVFPASALAHADGNILSSCEPPEDMEIAEKGILLQDAGPDTGFADTFICGPQDVAVGK